MIRPLHIGKGVQLSRQTLLICFGPTGRLLNAFCASQRLREALPDQHLVLLTHPSLVGLAQKAPWFDDIITANIDAPNVNLSHLVKALKQNRFDAIIDLERSATTAKLFAGFGLFPPKFAGCAPKAKWRIKEMGEHPIDADARLLDKMGIAKIPMDLSAGPELGWLLRLAGKTPSLQPEYFGLNKEYVLFNLKPMDEDMHWPASALQDLCQQILDQDVLLAITGTMAARELAKPLVRAFPSIRDLCARADAVQLAALGAKAKGVVGFADGVLHLCSAGAGRCISLHHSAESAKMEAIRAPNAMTLLSQPLAPLTAKDVVRAMKMFGAL